MRPLTPIVALAVLLGASTCTRRPAPGAVHATHTFPARADKLVRVDVRSLDVRVNNQRALRLEPGVKVRFIRRAARPINVALLVILVKPVLPLTRLKT